MEFSTRTFNRGRAAELNLRARRYDTGAPYIHFFFCTILGVHREEHNMLHTEPHLHFPKLKTNRKGGEKKGCPNRALALHFLKSNH